MDRVVLKVNMYEPNKANEVQTECKVYVGADSDLIRTDSNVIVSTILECDNNIDRISGVWGYICNYPRRSVKSFIYMLPAIMVDSLETLEPKLLEGYVSHRGIDEPNDLEIVFKELEVAEASLDYDKIKELMSANVGGGNG